MKKTLSILLTVVLLAAGLMAPSTALTRAEWDAYLASDADACRGLVMQPGADGTQKNFSWYVPADTSEVCVDISTSPDMAEAVCHQGKVIPAYQGDGAAKVTVTGLEADTTYYYTCNTDGEPGNVYSFASAAADRFSALYVTDIHITDSEDDPGVLADTSLKFNEVLTQAQSKADIRYVLSAGDQASSGLRSEYVGLTAGQAVKSVAFALTFGNHDRKGVDYKYFKNLPNEYYGLTGDYQSGDYWFTQNDVLFLFIDSNSGSGTDHRAMVRAAVNANPQAKWRVAVMHHDLYSGSIESREDEAKLMRTLYSPLFDEYHIDLALTGHNHYYSVSHVLYNGKVTRELADGDTVVNAPGTVYMVSASLTRPREAAPVFSDRVAFGLTDDQSKTLYNILNFSSDAIAVKTYDYNTGDLFASFTLQKDSDYSPQTISVFRRIVSFLTDAIGTVYAFFNNFTVYNKLKDSGYTIDFLDAVNNNSLTERTNGGKAF